MLSLLKRPVNLSVSQKLIESSSFEKMSSKILYGEAKLGQDYPIIQWPSEKEHF